jgi:hypothetical protein
MPSKIYMDYRIITSLRKANFLSFQAMHQFDRPQIRVSIVPEKGNSSSWNSPRIIIAENEEAKHVEGPEEGGSCIAKSSKRPLHE